MRLGIFLVMGLGLGILLASACGSSGDDTTCTENGGSCVGGSCSNVLPYSCGTGGTCCLVSGTSSGSGSSSGAVDSGSD